MDGAFQATLRSLRRDARAPWMTGTVVAVVLLLAWGSWMALARVPLRASSVRARVEAADPPRDIEVTTTGAVLEVAVRLGDPVVEGQLLVRLDDTQARARRDEARALRDGLAAQLERMSDELGAREGEASLDAEARTAAAAAASEASEQARIQAQLAQQEAALADDLAQRGAIGQRELERARSEAARLAAYAAELAERARQATSERARQERGAVGLRSELERRRSELQSAFARAEATVAAAEAQVERHQIRSPVEGRIGRVSLLQEGSVVQIGQSVATVVPTGTLRLVAWFPAATAAGRIAPGQAARARLDGFPWTAYGTVPAVVARVGGEPDDAGTIQVELDLLAPERTRIPLQHGLPGVVEIDVERLAPSALLLRTVGQGA